MIQNKGDLDRAGVMALRALDGYNVVMHLLPKKAGEYRTAVLKSEFIIVNLFIPGIDKWFCLASLKL